MSGGKTNVILRQRIVQKGKERINILHINILTHYNKIKSGH